MLLDYPAFNMGLGKWLKQNSSCKVVYYIPPNEWLFLDGSSSRVCTRSDVVLTVYPHEYDHFREKCSTKVHYVGHPLLDYVHDASISKAEARKRLGLEHNSLVITLLPASRRQEMNLILPIMLVVASKVQAKCRYIKLHFVLSLALDSYEEKIEEAARIAGLENFTIWKDNSLMAIAASDVCLSKSGSTSLEVGLIGVPQVVIYRVGRFTSWVARRLLNFKLKYVSLVNLILESGAVSEYIQEKIDMASISEEVCNLLPNDKGELSEAAVKQLNHYTHLKEILKDSGAVARASEIILNLQKEDCK